MRGGISYGPHGAAEPCGASYEVVRVRRYQKVDTGRERVLVQHAGRHDGERLRRLPLRTR